MAHKMGLVKIILGTKNVPTTRNYSASGSHAADDTGMKYTDAAGTTTVTASSSFDDSCKPYNPNSANYWYVIRGTTAEITHKKTFKSATTVNTDWEYTDVSVNQGKYREITVNNSYIKRLCYKFTAVFSCTQTYQAFKLPVKGSATYECWGASGGNSPGVSPYNSGSPGRGGYTIGTASFAKGTQLYLYVGEQGKYDKYCKSQGGEDIAQYNDGGWNGGGGSGCNGTNNTGSGGGGATDIRLVRHTDENGWGGLYSLRSRIMVAGGGGGCMGYDTSQYTDGGYGGGLVGGPSIAHDVYVNPTYNNTGGNQTSTGACNYYETAASMVNNYIPRMIEEGVSPYGNFGYANPGHLYWWGGGAGSGWYAGIGGFGRGGTGGSSFISGHSGCRAVDQSNSTSTITVHKSGANQERYDNTYYFTGTSMTQGATNSPGGHNGYARITMNTPIDN